MEEHHHQRDHLDPRCVRVTEPKKPTALVSLLGAVGVATLAVALTYVIVSNGILPGVK